MFQSALFLLQLAVIVASSRLMAFALRRLGQPQVVGEMAAGIALGPTLFGAIAPRAFQALFPSESLGFLNAFSEAGLVVFLFLTGVRVDFSEFRRQISLAAITSAASLFAPLLMGGTLALYLYPRYGRGDHISFYLFIGIAFSVTAFPVLARILVERNLLETPVGVVAMASAAVNDMTAWILLAAVLALMGGSAAHPLWVTVFLLASFVLVLFAAGFAFELWARRAAAISPSSLLPLFLTVALLAGAAGDWIGIHPFSGAFLAGLAVPRRFRDELLAKLEPWTLLLPAPVFFALTGIRTNLLVPHAADLYLDAFLILLTAVASKWGGAAFGARLSGMSWRGSLRLGALMNTRGLVELVILNIGMDRRILSPELFSIMVLMALITTAMTTPLIDWLGADSSRQRTSQGVT
jgi:Kef-type K+ transport system membrane component KefB